MLALVTGCASHDALRAVDLVRAGAERVEVVPDCADGSEAFPRRDYNSHMARRRPVPCADEDLDHRWARRGPAGLEFGQGRFRWVSVNCSRELSREPGVDMEGLLARLEHEPLIPREALEPEVPLPSLDKCRTGGPEVVIRAVNGTDAWLGYRWPQVEYYPTQGRLRAHMFARHCALPLVETAILVRPGGPAFASEVLISADHAHFSSWPPYWRGGCKQPRRAHPRCRDARTGRILPPSDGDPRPP